MSTASVTVAASWMTQSTINTTPTAAGYIAITPGTPTRLLRDPADLRLADGALDPVAAVLLADDHPTSRTLHRIARLQHVLEHGGGQPGRSVVEPLGLQFSLVLEAVLTLVNRAAREAVVSAADLAGERVHIVAVVTPSGAVGRRAVVAVRVSALCFTSAQLQVPLENVFGYECPYFSILQR